jgi:hypothetical protein
MSTQRQFPFTLEQFHALRLEQQQAVDAVTRLLAGCSTRELSSDEQLSKILSLLSPPERSPEKDPDEDTSILSERAKLAAIYESALELAEQELFYRGFDLGGEFSFCLVIDPNLDDSSHITIVDCNWEQLYLFEWTKASQLHFQGLQPLAEEVLRIKSQLIRKVGMLKANELNKHCIYVVLEGGLVQEVIDLPPNMELVVLDYDVEDQEDERLETSPLDDRRCYINRF